MLLGISHKFLYMKKFLALLFITGSFCSNAQQAFEFNGSNQYITFGTAANLGSNTFTLECWFYKKGAGNVTSTGTGGVTDVIPLISKGRGEADGNNRDMNYLLGIKSSTSVLIADFEEGTGQPTPGLNHPVIGNTAIQNNTWYHAAVTFDGQKWKLYLNGVLDGQDSIGVLPQSGSIQHAAIASALTSTGAAQGYFQGVIDEVRIWNTARTMQDIRDSINKQVQTATGLVGRWAMDDVTGTTLTGTGSSSINGTRTNNPTPVSTGAPYNIVFLPPNYAPAQPTNFIPVNYDTAYYDSTLTVTVTDPELDNLKVIFMGREHLPIIDSPVFTILPIPDTQFYTSEKNGGKNATFKVQTKWIVDSMKAKNIVYAIQLGDCVEDGDNGGNDIQWKRADTSMKILEDPVTTLKQHGLPFGICVGNHDQSPPGPTGTTVLYNQFFGASRFAGRSYYGGHYGANNDNHYQLFSASSFDFISISLEYDTQADTNVLRWADSLLKAYPTRRGIVSSHWLINSNGTFSAQGQATYDKLKNNANLDLMLCGHINPNGEARRSDTFNKHVTHTLLSDYQDRTNGGNGWLRIMEFNPGANTISVKTYSPTLNQFETDANSQFVLSYQMSNSWDTIAVVIDSPSGSSPSAVWKGLKDKHRYDWYAIVSDTVKNVTTSPVQTFTFRVMPDTTTDTNTTVATMYAQVLELYPNPNDGKNIILSYPGEVQAQILIFDVNGRIVYNDKIMMGSKIQLPVILETGFYTLQALIEDKRITKKLLVQ
jgi:hypothetical protein